MFEESPNILLLVLLNRLFLVIITSRQDQDKECIRQITLVVDLDVIKSVRDPALHDSRYLRTPAEK
jgi:hypothetical protein